MSRSENRAPPKIRSAIRRVGDRVCAMKLVGVRARELQGIEKKFSGILKKILFVPSTTSCT
jgi:hypothetical protein